MAQMYGAYAGHDFRILIVSVTGVKAGGGVKDQRRPDCILDIVPTMLTLPKESKMSLSNISAQGIDM